LNGCHCFSLYFLNTRLELKKFSISLANPRCINMNVERNSWEFVSYCFFYQFSQLPYGKSFRYSSRNTRIPSFTLDSLLEKPFCGYQELLFLPNLELLFFCCAWWRKFRTLSTIDIRKSGHCIFSWYLPVLFLFSLSRYNFHMITQLRTPHCLSKFVSFFSC
jgi:hypothetical protein